MTETGQIGLRFNLMDEGMINNPLVSICMVTFNHGKWIEKAINGVLIQKTDFPFELVIGDDASTDATRKIIEDFQFKEPSIVKAAFNTLNLGLAKNFSLALNRCRGRYIAICEGDDFWTDPTKLQKQIDFLESNPDCVITSHNFSTLHESENMTDRQVKYNHDFDYDQRKTLMEWMTQPLTCTFRNIFRDYTYFNKEGIFCDVVLFYEILKHGRGYFMKDDMATFRVHQNALSSGLTRWQWLRNHVIMFDYMHKNNPDDNLLQCISRKYCLSLYIDKLKRPLNPDPDFKPLSEYFKRSPGVFEGSFTIVKLPFYFLKYGFFSKVKSALFNG